MQWVASGQRHHFFKPHFAASSLPMEEKSVAALTIAKVSFVSSTTLSYALASAMARPSGLQHSGSWMRVENRRKSQSNEDAHKHYPV